jgi:uncharacterized protein YbjT (DUF2867 family)
MILVTGASGQAGRAVLLEVRKLGVPFRALYRAVEDVRKAAAESWSVVADFADKESMKRALQGVTAVYLVCSPIPALADLESNVIEACQESGISHVVLNSALGAGDYDKSFPAWHRLVEDKLKASGLGYTIFRPNGFMQNILTYYAPSIRSQGAFYAAMGNARTSYLDLRDIAVVVARALASPMEYSGMTYELNGPEAVSCPELAERISRTSGRHVSYVDIPDEAQRASMLQLGMPEWQVAALLDLQRYYTNGQGGEVTDVLAGLLGRAPIGLHQFLEEFKDDFRQQAASA